MVMKGLVFNALSRLWSDRCTIWGKENYINSQTGRMEQREIVLIQNAPCRVSYGSLQPVSNTRGSASQRIKTSLQSLGASSVKGQVKLFLAADTPVPPGSRVMITRNGRMEMYHLSGAPAVYSSHMEVPLVLEQNWA